MALPALDGSYWLSGTRRDPVPDHTLEVRSPVDGSLTGRVHEFTHAEIDAVFRDAAAVQPRWGDAPLDERAAVVHQAADVLAEHTGELAELLVMEIAKA